MIKKILHKFFYKRNYWVYRTLAPQYNEKGEVITTKQTLELHFIKPFKTKREARAKIKTHAKYYESWQEFVIISD